MRQSYQSRMSARQPARARALGRAVTGAILNLIWPPRSLLGPAIVSAPGAILAEEWARLTFLTDPACARCGFPFETDQGEDALCLGCAAYPPPFASARSALAYDDASRRLAIELKHQGRSDGLALFAGWMAQAGARQLQTVDLIAPVPLHWTRLLARRRNQAASLAQAVGKATGLKVDPFAIKRLKRTISQHGLNANERARNVRAAFRADPARVAGRHVLLIDDVYTTGATAAACARALKRAKAASTHVLTLTRVVRPAERPI